MVLINASLVCSESLSNFHSENSTAFHLILWWKSNGASPQVHQSTQKTILNKLLLWEYNNGGAPFSWQKSSRVSRLMCYGTSIGFHACVYGSFQHARDRMSQSPSKYQTYWCVLHTWGNQCHLWHGSGRSHSDDYAYSIASICTYSNCLGHIPTLQGQEYSWLEWVSHVATRVHHTKCTITHIHAYIYIYIYTHTHTSCIMLSHRAGE